MQRRAKRYNFPVEIVALGYQKENHAWFYGDDTIYTFAKVFPYPIEVEDEKLDYIPSILGGYFIYNFVESRFYVGKDMVTKKVMIS